MINKASSRVECIDLLRGVAALMVVFLHLSGVRAGHLVPVVVGQVIHAFCRCAVPFFLLTTGFFYPHLLKSGRWKKHITKLLWITLASTLFYIVFSSWYNGQRLLPFIVSAFNATAVFKWFLYNYFPPFSGGHLWYFYAILYVLLICRLFDTLRIYGFLKVIAIVSFLFLLASALLPIPSEYVRSYFGLGLPYVILGRCLREGVFDKFIAKTSTKIIIFLIIVFSILLVAEVLFYSFYFSPDNPTREHHLFTMPLVFLVFVLSLRIKVHSRIIVLLSSLGRKYSAGIYVFHACVGLILGRIIPSVTLLQSMALNIPLTFLLSLLVSMGVVWMLGNFSARR